MSLRRTVGDGHTLLQKHLRKKKEKKTNNRFYKFILTELSLERWLDSHFFLNFSLNAPTGDNQYTGLASEKIIFEPTTNSNGKCNLFLKFATSTEYVIRATVFYRQKSNLAVDSEGKTTSTHSKKPINLICILQSSRKKPNSESNLV